MACKYIEKIMNTMFMSSSSFADVWNSQDSAYDEKQKGVKMNEVVVSILTFNKLEYTKKCIYSILENTTLPYHRIVVSDNNSTDGTVEWLKGLGNNIRLIENKENLGFAKAHNAVMQEYSYHDIVLMNNDIEVPPDWLKKLQEAVYSEYYGAVSPAIKVNNGLDVGAVLDSQARGRSLINDSITEPDWITGSCLYIKNSTIQRIGILDNFFNFYYEDVDYCIRMKKENIKFKCIQDVKVVHHNSVSTNPAQKKFMMEESKKYFVEKHKHWLATK